MLVVKNVCLPIQQVDFSADTNCYCACAMGTMAEHFAEGVHGIVIDATTGVAQMRAWPPLWTWKSDLEV